VPCAMAKASSARTCAAEYSRLEADIVGLY